MVSVTSSLYVPGSSGAIRALARSGGRGQAARLRASPADLWNRRIWGCGAGLLVVRMTRGREGLCLPACPSRAPVPRCVPTGFHTRSAARFSAGAAGLLTLPWGLGVDLGAPLTPGPARTGGSGTEEEADLPQVHLPRRRPRPAAGHVLVSGGRSGGWRLEGSPWWVGGCSLTCGRGPCVGERAELRADKNESLRLELNRFPRVPFGHLGVHSDM